MPLYDITHDLLTLVKCQFLTAHSICSLAQHEGAMNNASRQRLAKVHPELASRVTRLIETLAREGIVVEVVQGLRTFTEQDALFAQGRTKPGQIVTNARGGQSNHNYGLAVDLCPFVNGRPHWKDNSGFIRIGAEAAKLGLQWGGSWKKFIDKPHVQLPGLTVRQCFALYQNGGLANVWCRVPALDASVAMTIS